MRFKEWRDARNYAQDRADKTGLNVAIRAQKEYGKNGYNVSFASKNDSDYECAEIVRPNEPKSEV